MLVFGWFFQINSRIKHIQNIFLYKIPAFKIAVAILVIAILFILLQQLNMNHPGGPKLVHINEIETRIVQSISNIMKL